MTMHGLLAMPPSTRVHALCTGSAEPQTTGMTAAARQAASTAWIRLFECVAILMPPLMPEPLGDNRHQIRRPLS